MKEKNGIYDWSKHIEVVKSENGKPDQTSRVEIDDETLRDGLQGTQIEQHPSTEEKKIYLEWASRFVEHADIGFPGSEEEHQQEILELIKHSIARRLEITLSCAARGAASEDVKPIVDISEALGGYPLEADLFLDGSKYRAQKEGWERKERLAQLAQNIKLLNEHSLPVMFVAERATSTPPEELFETCQIAADLGVERMCFADTQGKASYQAVTNMFQWGYKEIGSRYPNLKWDFHGHNDLGLGVVNCLAASQEGVDRVHATSFGIGERSGNVDLATTLTVLNLKGFRQTDLTKLKDFSRIASEILHFPIPRNAPVIGESAHATSSGVHSAPLDKAEDKFSDIYFAYDPGIVGGEPKVEVGRFSGAATVRYKLKALSIPFNEEMVMEILDVAKKGRGFLSETTIRGIAQRHLNHISEKK